MEKDETNTAGTGDSHRIESDLSRRDFIIGSTVALAGSVFTVAALTPLLNAKEIPSANQFFQQHYQRLSGDDKKVLFQRIEKQIEKKYGIHPTISDPPPIAGVVFAYSLNIGRCIGCRKCVYACMKENNLSRQPQIQYIRVLKMKKEGMK